MEYSEKILFIKDLRKKGFAYERIGMLLGVSRQRIHQLHKGYSTKVKLSPITKLPNKLATVSKKLDTNGILDHGRDFTREAVRRRDGYRCQICLRKWKEGERRFDIHHLNGLCGKKSKSYDQIKDAPGLITLCHKCHLRLDTNRGKFHPVQN